MDHASNKKYPLSPWNCTLAWLPFFVWECRARVLAPFTFCSKAPCSFQLFSPCSSSFLTFFLAHFSFSYAPCSFLSPPVHFAQWAHMHHFLSVCSLSVRTWPKIRLDNKYNYVPWKFASKLIHGGPVHTLPQTNPNQIWESMLVKGHPQLRWLIFLCLITQLATLS